MKKLITLALTLVMLLQCVSLTSCNMHYTGNGSNEDGGSGNFTPNTEGVTAISTEGEFGNGFTWSISNSVLTVKGSEQCLTSPTTPCLGTAMPLK